MIVAIYGLACFAIGYAVSYFQHNPERWAELLALFKRTPKP